MLVETDSLVDLTYPLRSDMPVSTKERPVRIGRRMTHQKDGFCASSIEMGSHTGTHIDAPLHFFEDGTSVDQIPLNQLIGEGCLIDVRCSTGAITPEALSRAIEVSKGLEPGVFAVIRTGWDKYFGEPKMYDHPYLTGPSAQLLIEQGVSLVAIDAIGVDDSSGWEFPAHSLLLAAGIPIVENVRHLGLLTEPRLGFAFIPMAIDEGDAAPVRAFAWTLPS